MAVSAKSIGHPNHHGRQVFAVLVSNGKPGCRVSISGGERPVVTRLAANGTAWATVDAVYRNRTNRIVAQTKHCPVKESTSTRVAVTKGKVDGPAKIRHRTPVHLTLTQWDPHRRISVVAVNGRTVKRLTTWPDKQGRASVRLALERKGAWAVVVRQHGTSASTILRAT